jgi:hypothetical protein
VMAYTNHGNASSAERNSGWKPKLSEKDRHTLKRIVSKNHRTTATKVTAEYSIYLEDCLHRKSKVNFMNPPSMEELQLLHFWLLNTMLKGQKGGVMITKPGRPMNDNKSFNQLCSPSCFSQHQAGFMFGEHPRKPIILNAWFQLWNMEADLWRPGQQYLSIMLVPELLWVVKLLTGTTWCILWSNFFPWQWSNFLR